MRPSLVKLRREAPGQRVSPIARFILQKVFENTVRMIVAILAAPRARRTSGPLLPGS